MEDIDGGIHPALDGQSLDEDEDEVILTQAGAGIMEADDLQVLTVFTFQPSFHHRHSTNRVS